MFLPDKCLKWGIDFQNCCQLISCWLTNQFYNMQQWCKSEDICIIGLFCWFLDPWSVRLGTYWSWILFVQHQIKITNLIPKWDINSLEKWFKGVAVINKPYHNVRLKLKAELWHIWAFNISVVKWGVFQKQRVKLKSHMLTFVFWLKKWRKLWRC